MRLATQYINTSTAIIFLLLSSVGKAASLRVSPTTLELTAPESTATLNLGNESGRPVKVQIRVFSWTQEDYAERLVSTTDVVASPPAIVLPANSTYLIRVVRVKKAPIVAEESYRVVIDELPEPIHKQAGKVNLVVRHSVPVFFRNPNIKPSRVSWRLESQNERILLTAVNNGEGHLRLSNLKLSQGGRHLGELNGLVGYVLGGAMMQWPVSSQMTLTNEASMLRVYTQTGPLEANVTTRKH